VKIFTDKPQKNHINKHEKKHKRTKSEGDDKEREAKMQEQLNKSFSFDAGNVVKDEKEHSKSPMKFTDFLKTMVRTSSERRND
jgi:hypothetical protein